MSLPLLLQGITLENILSFGPAVSLPLGSLNVLIGPNGAGKSNVLNALELFSELTGSPIRVIAERGGHEDWVWKGSPEKHPRLTVDLENWAGNPAQRLRYTLELEPAAAGGLTTLHLVERVEEHRNAGFQVLYSKDERGIEVSGVRQDGVFDPERSLVAQLVDPVRHKALSFISFASRLTRIHRQFPVGPDDPVRKSQRVDRQAGKLEADLSNMVLVLNYLLQDVAAKNAMLEHVRYLFEGIEDIRTYVQAGHLQLVLHEQGWSIPATRLSDGTLRWIALGCLLIGQEQLLPGALICIEEPELGLHPDLLRPLARLLISASKERQILITTHSDGLVDALTEVPESVVICEREDGASKLFRVSASELKTWLEKYSLGQLWSSGELGGNRW